MNKEKKEMAIIIGVVSGVFAMLIVVGSIAGWLANSWEVVLFSAIVAVLVVIIYASIIIDYLKGSKHE